MGTTDFESARIRPLCHLSAADEEGGFYQAGVSFSAPFM